MRFSNPACDAADLASRLEELRRIVARLQNWEALLPAHEAWLRHPEALTPEGKHLLSRDTYLFSMAPAAMYKAAQHADLRRLYNDILQSYDLSPALRKKTEASVRFFAKSSARRSKRGAEIPTFRACVTTYVGLLAVAEEALREGTPKGACATADGYAIINSGGFDARVMESAADLCSAVARTLRSKRFPQLVYGPVIVTNNVAKGSVKAFYYKETDEVYLRARGDESDAFGTLLHEMAHRLVHKFGVDQRKMEILYREMIREHERLEREVVEELWRLHKPAPNEMLTMDGEMFRVLTISYDRRYRRTVEMVRVSDRRGAKISAEAYLVKTGRLDPETTKVPFVSWYARKDAEENFAEMFRAWCQDRLEGRYAEPFAQLILPLAR